VREGLAASFRGTGPFFAATAGAMPERRIHAGIQEQFVETRAGVA
jgi:hypothetical protein